MWKNRRRLERAGGGAETFKIKTTKKCKLPVKLSKFHQQKDIRYKTAHSITVTPEDIITEFRWPDSLSPSQTFIFFCLNSVCTDCRCRSPEDKDSERTLWYLKEWFSAVSDSAMLTLLMLLFVYSLWILYFPCFIWLISAFCSFSLTVQECPEPAECSVTWA